MLAGGLLIFWFARSPETGLYALFFSTAFLLTPELPIVREKLALPEVVAVAAWVGLLLGRIRFAGKRHIAAIIAGLPLILWIVVSFTVNAPSATKAGVFFDSLVETLNLVYGFTLFVLVMLIVDRPSIAWRCLLAWMAGAAVVCVIGLATLAGFGPEWALDPDTGRMSSTLKLENQVPSFLLPVLAPVVLFAFSTFVSHYLRGVLFILAGAIVVVAFATGSRTAMLMLAVVALGTLVVTLRELGKGALMSWRLIGFLTAGMVLIAVFIAGILANYTYDYRLVETPAWQRAAVRLADWLAGRAPLDETRPQQFAFAIAALPDFAWFGVGPKMATVAGSRGEIHNSYLGITLEAGIPAGLALLLWLLLLIVMGWRAVGNCPHGPTRLLGQAVLVAFAASLSYGLVIYGLRQRNIWLLAGLVGCLPQVAVWIRLEMQRVVSPLGDGASVRDHHRASAGPERVPSAEIGN